MTSIALGFLVPRFRVLGMDVAGVIEEVGADVTRFRPGDEVIAMLGSKFGGHAEYVTVKQDGTLTAKPRGMTFEDAAALVFGGITARALLSQVQLPPGASVLVNGASGAVGTAAVQLAHLAGSKVTAVCSARNRDLSFSLGADRVIDYMQTDFTHETTVYDLVIDCVGNATFTQLEPLIKPNGALLSVISDLTGVINARSRSRRTGKRIIAGNVPYRSSDLADVARLASTGRFRPVIDKTFDLTDIAGAHRYVDTGRKRGNVVVRITASSTPEPHDESISDIPLTPSVIS